VWEKGKSIPYTNLLYHLLIKLENVHLLPALSLEIRDYHKIETTTPWKCLALKRFTLEHNLVKLYTPAN